MEIGEYLRILRKWLWLIILCAVFAGALSFFISAYVVKPSYRASTTLMVKTSDLTDENAADSQFNDYDTFLANEYMTTTFGELAQKRPVREAAAQLLNIDANQLNGRIQIKIVPKTPLLIISFEDPDAGEAARVANGIATTMIQVTQQLSWMPGRELAVIEEATLPQSPVSPRTELNTAVAAVIGGILALVGALVAEALQRAEQDAKSRVFPT